MRKILIFFLIIASFSCATLDSDLKEEQSVEKKVEEPKSKLDTENLEVKDKDLEKSKENVVPAKETIESSLPNVKKEEEKTPISSPNGEKTKNEKKDEKRTTVSSSSKSKGTETKEALESRNKVKDERALRDYEGLFANSTKVEPRKKENKEDRKKVLPSLEILKELDEALNFFKKIAPPSVVATKQRVEKKEKDSKSEKKAEQIIEEQKDDVIVTDVEPKDETLPPSTPPIASFNEEKTPPTFNDEPTFNFDDEEPQFSFNDEETPFNFNEEATPFNFDDEKKGVGTEKKRKNDVQDDKGQLSSIVDEEDKVNISRYTNILKGQNIDFSYPGEGWVYLGEETSQKGLNYVKRKMEDGKTFFTFTAENEGNYVLNFSYFDVFSGDFIVDAVSVKVMPNNGGVQKDALVLEYQGKNEKKGKEEQSKKSPNEVNVDADKVSINTENIEKKEVNPINQPSNKMTESNVETLKPATSTKEQDGTSYKEPEVFTNIASISPENAKKRVSGEDAKKIINEVSEAISKGNAKRALERLDDFFAVASTNMDEAYFLRGKAYELNTEQKNIKMALASYKFLTKTFPNSPLWNEADARIRYIEKFFVKIK